MARNTNDKAKYLSHGASFSDDGLYRYSLTREWSYGSLMSPLPARNQTTLGFVMLNPSTADAMVDDPTIRRCVGFAKREGYDRMMVCNAFAFRATNPKELKSAEDPEGPENVRTFQEVLPHNVICAWGANDVGGSEAIQWLREGNHELYCLGATKSGAPKHPLYLPTNAPLRPYEVQP